MPSSSVSKQAEEVLEEVLRTIRQEYESLYPVLREMDRNRFVEEETSLREQLKETIESEPNRWRGFLSLSSPQARATKCLKEAEELRRRVKEAINTAKLRTTLTGMSGPSPGSAFNLMGAGTPETDVPLAEGDPRPAAMITSSSHHMHCSPLEPEVSEVNVNPAAQNDHDYTSDINEAINSPLEVSSESSGRSRDSSSRPHRRSPPPPPRFLSPLNTRCFLSEPEVAPLETSSDSSDGIRDSSSRRRRRSPPPPRRMSQSGNAGLLLDTSSNSGSDTPRRSHSVRRPAPPPPQSPRQSRTPRSPTNVSFPSPRPLPPGPAITSSVSKLAQDINTLASSMAAEISRQAKGRQGQRYSDTVSKTNCMDINNSNVKGVTMNNGGKNNSGAVIHEMMMPPTRLPRPVPQC